MPRAKSAKAAEALNLYRQGYSLKEISERLGVPEGSIRSWKNREKWDERYPGLNAMKRNAMKRCVANDRRNPKKGPQEAPEPEDDEISENSGLTEKQRLFCVYYSKTFNATRAYQKAYGVSWESACGSGSRLLKNVRVRDEITRLKKMHYERDLLTEEDIFRKYIDIAFNDVTDYFETVDVKGEQMLRVKDLSNVDGTLINELIPTRYGIRIVFPDRQKALDWLADHMDLATEEQKARIQALKQKTGSEPAEVVDDGFLDAMNGSAAEDWTDYEDS